MENIYRNVLEGNDVGANVMLLPGRRAHTYRQNIDAIVEMFHPDAPIATGRCLYEKNRKAAKNKWLTAFANEQTKMNNERHSKKLRLTPWLGQFLQPLNLSGPAAFPMPIEIPSTIDPFLPILSLITSNSVIDQCDGVEIDPYTNVLMKKTQRGIIYNDGRLDLCKQSLGPKYIIDLMDALRHNDKIRHFLLGNNCISTTGAKHIADYITAKPDQISTWYLAGCHLTAPAFGYLVNAMIKSKSINNIWLKRNPLGRVSALFIVRLIVGTQNLRTLDLENVELGDTGAHELFSTLATIAPAESIGLQNLYLNANGLGARGMEGLATYLRHPTVAASLQSLFLSSNPIGDEGVQKLVEGGTLQTCKTLKVLAMQSCGLTSKGIILLAEALLDHPTLTCLHLFRSKTTTPHHQRENHIGPEAVEALRSLIGSSKSALRVLALGRTALTQNDIHYLTEPLRKEKDGALLAALNVRGQHGEGLHQSVKQILRKNKSTLAKELGHTDDDGIFADSFAFRAFKNNTDIQFIDSYYRNAGRSCSMKQYWDKDDPHWQMILEDATIII